MKLSIIIPTHNRCDTLRLCLDSVTQQTYSDYEVIVVDDASTDDTPSMIKRDYPQVTYIHLEHNRGPAAARNIGIYRANGDIIVFTDDDCVPPRDWLERLMDGYARYPQIAGVGGALEAPAEMLRHNALARHERSVWRDEYGARDSELLGGFEIPTGGTNNMSYRRITLLNAGGFDETFPFAAAEDTDIKLRICETGAQLLYIPVRVTHLQPYTWDAFRRRQITRGRGVVHFERKHVGHPPTFRRIVLRMAKRGARLIRDLIFKRDRQLSLIRFAAGWYECIGQLHEVRRIAR